MSLIKQLVCQLWKSPVNAHNCLIFIDNFLSNRKGAKQSQRRGELRGLRHQRNVTLRVPNTAVAPASWPHRDGLGRARPISPAAASHVPTRFVVLAVQARPARERSTPLRTSRRERADSLPTSSRGSRRTWWAPLRAGDYHSQRKKQEPCAARPSRLRKPVAQDNASTTNHEPRTATNHGKRMKKNRPGFTRAVFRISGLAAHASPSATGRPSGS